MAALAILLEFTNIPLPNGRDDSLMLRVMEPGLPKHHVLKMSYARISCHAIIWLRVVPVSPPLLLLGPLRSLSLLLTTSLDVFAAQVNEIYLVNEIHDNLLCGAQKSKFRSPSSSGLQVGGNLAQAVQRSSTPVVSARGIYVLRTYYKESLLPCDELKGKDVW